VVIISCPWILIFSIFSIYYILKIRKINQKLTKDTYRLKAVLMSPINSLIQDTINGLTTIRAFNRSDHFLQQMFDLTDI